jgi:hypothetical protein
MSSDSSVASAAFKACCKCGIDVAGMPRMKDSHGKYWCMPCGQADERRKQTVATHLNCAGCRKLLPKGKLDKDGDHVFCKACLKKRSRVSAAASSAGNDAVGSVSAGDRRRVVVMAAVLIMLVIMSVLFNFIFAG